MTTIPLYQLGDALERIAETLIENGGELTPELEAELAKLEGAFDEKVERIALYVQNLSAMAHAANAEITRLTGLAVTRIKAADAMKRALRNEMERTGRTKIETARVKAWIQRNSRPSISWPDGRAIPPEYERVTVSLDGQRAYDDWKRGVLPEGFAVEHGSHLRIK